MKKILAMLWLCSVCSFALTLADVRESLSKNAMAGDTLELRLETVIETAAGRQNFEFYLVQMGQKKAYMELKGPLMNERSVVNGDRMKVTDLNSGSSKVMPYNGEALHSMMLMNGDAIAKGNWSEPKIVSGNSYVLKGGDSELFYNAKKKHIEKIVRNMPNGSSEMVFEYNENNELQRIVTSVEAEGVNTSIVSNVKKIRPKADLPERFFEF